MAYAACGSDIVSSLCRSLAWLANRLLPVLAYEAAVQDIELGLSRRGCRSLACATDPAHDAALHRTQSLASRLCRSRGGRNGARSLRTLGAHHGVKWPLRRPSAQGRTAPAVKDIGWAQPARVGVVMQQAAGDQRPALVLQAAIPRRSLDRGLLEEAVRCAMEGP